MGAARFRVPLLLAGCVASFACGRGARSTEPTTAERRDQDRSDPDRPDPDRPDQQTPKVEGTPAHSEAQDPEVEAGRPDRGGPAASPPFVELDVPGFLPAVLGLPRDSSRPRPVLVAAHGAGDGPRWQCELWRQLLAARGFVLCPAGVPFGKEPDTGYFFRNHHELEREVMAAVAALRAAYGEAVDPGPMVYTGYSQGATMGALMLVDHGDTFERLVLIEGGYGEWNVSIAKEYGSGGGRRVLFACGIRTCRNKAQRSAAALERAGLEARVEYAEGAGHTYGGPVAEKVFGALDWVLEGDPRWR